MKGDRERCLAAGMDTYLTKPVNRLQLEECIRTILSRAAQTPLAADGTANAPIGGAASVEAPAAASTDTAPVDQVPPIDSALAFRNPGRRLRADFDPAQEIRGNFLSLEWEKMTGSLATSDLKTISRSAHTLKGTAAYLAAQPIAEAAAALEHCQHDEPSAEAIRRLLGQLRPEIDRFVAYLPKLSEQFGQVETV